ncbi:MAG: hypothetical protein M0R49_11440 [Limnochordia bacterium]|nr:hypothetical protein [Limnochordia bacterium]
MRRMIFVFLVVVGILVLGVRFIVNERQFSESPPGLEIQYVEYGSRGEPSAAKSPIAQLRDSIDDLSKAALQGQWTQASRILQQLDEAWRALTPGNNAHLETEKEIERTIQNLYYNVWAQDEQALLSTAQKLTLLLTGLES